MKISVSFLGFSSKQELADALKAANAQCVSAELELIVCDPENVLDKAVKEAVCKEYSAVICEDADDTMGILKATGEYIAIYAAGYNWKRNDKLASQLAVLEAEPGCVLTFHDVEVLQKNGYPVDQDIRNRYIRTVGFEQRTYDLKNLQKFHNCGFFGTWMLRNILLQEKERALYAESTLPANMRLWALLLANGCGKNLYDDRFVACQYDEALYKSRNYPKYSMNKVEALNAELDLLQKLLQDNYGYELDFGYRRMQIANGAFNFFAENELTDTTVKNFQTVFQLANISGCMDGTADDEEVAFFEFLRDKIRRYVAKVGNEACLPLLSYIEGTSDEKWSYAIRDCKNKKFREAMLKQYEKQNPEARKLIAADRRRSNPIVRFFGKIGRKIKKIMNKIGRSGRRFILWRMRKKGYTDYMSKEWYDSVSKNLLTDKDTPLKQKIWCYRRGFMPWRIYQYELTNENYKQYPSDRDYMYLHQMNCSYKKWIEDKMTFRLVLDPFKEHLPKYYFQIVQRDDKQLIVKLPDLPEGFEPTFDELFRLLRQEGKLALKAASGTHGVGFYKMHYEDGKYYLNNEEVSEYKIRKTINSFKSFYVVTNYINMHDQIKNIYAGSVNTIRIMMINRDGHHPELMDAYMRVGSVNSGVTDNVAFGGVVCTIDMETGEYSNGMQIKDHVFINIDTHPDTQTPLQGVIPNWEQIKQGLIDISNYMPQLEYLGFDVVCTPEGFTVLEINSHQDLHRLRYYDQRVRDFLLYKLHRKERRFKIKRKY